MTIVIIKYLKMKIIKVIMTIVTIRVRILLRFRISKSDPQFIPQLTLVYTT